jgi:hypothetical protein
MRDAIVTYPDGKRVAVSDLPLDELQRLIAIAASMTNTGHSDRTVAQFQDRLNVELVIRQRRLNQLL